MKVNARWRKPSSHFALLHFKASSFFFFRMLKWCLKPTASGWALTRRRKTLVRFIDCFRFDMNKTFFYVSQLPLLKALIDRLLQDGVEELLHVLGTSRKMKENTEIHTSNIITEYSVCKLKKTTTSTNILHPKIIFIPGHLFHLNRVQRRTPCWRWTPLRTLSWTNIFQSRWNL